MEFQKSNFNMIYNEVSPIPYINYLKQYYYRQPDFVYDTLIQKVQHILEKAGRCQVVDIACSYGFNGRIIKNGISYEKFLQKNCLNDINKTSVIGVDISSNALNYALKNNYIDVMICQDLEREDVSLEYIDVLKKTHLVIASGAFSYIGIKTLQQIYSSRDNKADFIGWPSCSYDKSALLGFLRSMFYEVHIHPTIFPMREFTCKEERESFRIAMKHNNPEFYEQFSGNLSVFQIIASRRK